MSTFADTHAARTAARIRPTRPKAPSGFEPGVRYEAGVPAEVVVQLDTGQTIVPEDEAAWRADITRTTGLVIPEGRRVEVAQVRYWGDPATPQVYVRFTITDREGAEREHIDHAELVRIIREAPRRRVPKTGAGRTRVVVISDLQVGKVAGQGGTRELHERVAHKVQRLRELAKTDPCADLVIIDPGDLIENVNNVESQRDTNDLSLPEQFAVARSILTFVVSELRADYASTRVVTVPSNHGQWRVSKGKGGGAGKPSDDFGIDTHKAVAEKFAFAGRDDVSWIVPETWRESLALQVRGLVIGVTHGHQFNPGQAPKWWAGQTHGDQPTASAHLLIHGHYHNASVQQSGAIDGRPRWILGADAMDGGSDWFQNLTGEVSEPSVLTFTVDDAGRWEGWHRIVGERPDPELGDAGDNNVVALRVAA